MMLIESAATTNSSKSRSNNQDILSMGDSIGGDDPFGQKLYSFQQDGDIFEPGTAQRLLIFHATL